MEQEFPSAAPVLAFSRMSVWLGLIIVPVGLVYPVVVLVLLTRPKIVAAFEGRPAPPAKPTGRDELPPGAFTR
jgi:hypothetical protein